AFEFLRRDRHRHAVMQRGEVAAGGCGDDGDAVGLLAVRPHPGFRECGKAYWTAVAAMDEKGPLAAARILPFVIAVGRNHAAPPLDRDLARRLFQNLHGALIEQKRTYSV